MTNFSGNLRQFDIDADIARVVDGGDCGYVCDRWLCCDAEGDCDAADDIIAQDPSTSARLLLNQLLLICLMLACLT